MPTQPNLPVPSVSATAVETAAPSSPATRSSTVASELANTELAQLKLTDFLDLATLQEIQDAFFGVTQLTTTIRDAEGNPLTQPTDEDTRRRSDNVLAQIIGADDPNLEGPFHAPIVVDGRNVGSISIEFPKRDTSLVSTATEALLSPVTTARNTLRDLARTLGVADEAVDPFVTAAEDCCGPKKAAAVQFLYILATALARLCYQDFQLRRRYEEVSALHRLSTMLAGQRDLQLILDTAARQTPQAFGVHAASIRLLDAASDQMIPRAVFNLSTEFLQKGPLPLKKSKISQQAFEGQIVYVADMSTDKRTVYPDFFKREGLVSSLSAGIIYRGKPVGVISIYAQQLRTFTRAECALLQSIGHMLAGAIANAQLDETRREAQFMQRQLKLGADVQQRMLPTSMPQVAGLDIAARCVQSLDVGGDFYDFLQLEKNLGIAIGDVSGKGVAASLLMAGARASLRAFAEELYDIDEIMFRVNRAICRDVRDGEFLTLFYGVLDEQKKRLTYCNAGHEPPLLLRDGRFHTLDAGGMILGVDPAQRFEKGIIDLRKGDCLLLSTDGLSEAMNFRQQRFGRTRVRKALKGSMEFATAHEALNHILWEMRRFTGLSQRSDDTTMVLLRVM